MEQKNELYHYGVKGMKWGKHKKPDLREFWDKRITGDYYKRSPGQIKNSPGRPKKHSPFKYGSGDYARSASEHIFNARQNFSLAESARREPHVYVGGRKKGLEVARQYNVEGRRSQNRADRMMKNYYTKSLKGITESNTKKVKNWISTRPSAVKKKVSEIKEKIAKAESGKKTVTYPLSRDANKKKTKKSTIKSSSHYMSNY